MNVFILESRGESELMCLSGAIERGTDRERERTRISSLAICINQPLFDACGRQPSANRRTEVKLKKKVDFFFFQKNLPGEINNNNNKG